MIWKILVAISVLSISCSEKKLSGKPLSYWEERINDLDPQTAEEAFREIGKLSQADLATMKSSIEKAANSGNRSAVLMLSSKFGITKTKWLPHYMDALYSGFNLKEKDCYELEGAAAIRSLHATYPEEVLEALEKESRHGQPDYPSFYAEGAERRKLEAWRLMNSIKSGK